MSVPLHRPCSRAQLLVGTCMKLKRPPWVTGHVPLGWSVEVWALMWTVRYALAILIVLLSLLVCIKVVTL